MNFLKVAREIKEMILKNKEIEFYIINNTLGKNLILLIGDEKVTEKLKRKLKENFKDYIEDIYISNKTEETSYLLKEIKKIGKKNDIFHRNSSYKSWMRSSKELSYTGAKIISGYSFKGGMGRSSTIAYLALFLYFLGKKIVILDCDFEAPGIATMFFNKKERIEKNGIIDFLIDVNLKTIEQIDNYFIESEVSNSGGNLYLFPSGIDFQSNEYLNKISKIDFNSELYNKNFLKLLNEINKVIKPDLIFIDLRAGINESNGFILNEISDKNLLFFNSEEQNVDGMNVVLNKIKSENSTLVNSLIRFTLSEISELKEKEFIKIVENNFEEYKIKNILNEESDEELEEELKILNLPYKSEFLESISKFKAFVQSQVSIKNSGSNNYFLQNFIEKLELDDKEIRLIEINKISRTNILEKLKIEFDKVTGVSKFEKEEDLKYFYFKEDLVRIVNEQIFLIRGSKGSGKSSLFEIFIKNYKEILNKLNNKNNTYIEGFSINIMTNLTSDHFIKLSEIAKNDIQIYERFWKYLTVFQLENYLNKNERSFNDYSNFYDKLKDTDFSISIDDKLKKINGEFYNKNEHYTLVYDELDVAFSNKKDEIISALISFWRNNIYKYANLRSKIFLRKDIFNSLNKLENKTHLEINSYDLNWKKKEILSLILKIVVCTLSKDELKDLGLENIILKEVQDKIELVDNENEISEAIFKIFGKKVNEARVNITTMDNWIIQELSDGNGDITPRSIYKFMSSTIKYQLEREEDKNLENSILFSEFQYYHKKVLKDCSDARITEYKEEYKEYESLIENIKKVGYGKFSLNDYSDILSNKKTKAKDDLEKLIKSGFLKIEKETHYKVANIYFEALGIKKSKQGAKAKNS